MNKISLLVASLFVVAAGCATNKESVPSHVAAADDQSVATVTQIGGESLKVGSTTGKPRNPAASADIRWVADSASVVVSPGGTTQDVQVSPRQIEYWQELVRFDCTLNQWHPGTCYDYQCSGGTGKSELWDAYYNGGGDRSVSLDKAILGIGESSARKLHQSGVFNKKPRSWKEFQERMDQALRNNVITYDQYNQVFGTYKSQNQANLGYIGDSCRDVAYSCDVYGPIYVRNGCERLENFEEVRNVKTFNIRLNVVDPQLQSFESEKVLVSADGPTVDSIGVSHGSKTQYEMVNREITSNGVALTIRGAARYKIDLPASALTGVTYNDAPGIPFQANVSVDPNYLGQGGNDQLMVTMKVSYCNPPKNAPKLQDCARISLLKAGKKEFLAPVIQPLTQAITTVKLPGIPPGKRIWVEYSLHRENSRWYNNSPVATKVQEIGTYKK